MKIPLSLSFFTLVSLANISRAAQPWDQPFSPSTDQILKNAAALPLSEKAEVLYLLQDRHYEFQSNGAATTTFRCLYRVAKQSALEDWSAIEQSWEPWHETKPELRARVISANGSVHWLDPKTIADAPASQWDSTIFSDTRVIRAPLPAIDAGSVVEYEIIQHETAPLFAAGVTSELPMASGVPIERFHVAIDAPKNISIKTNFRLLNQSDIVRSDSKNGAHIEVEVGRHEPREDFALFAPPEANTSPSFSFSTGASWQQVASQYQKLIDQTTAGTDTKALFAALDLDPASLPAAALDRVALLAVRLHQKVRYTGVEFGQAALVPNAPAEVIRRHYGDCKDKAVLLATLLKAVGLDAHLALLNAGAGLDVDPTLPGLGRFNHAIVYVNSSKPLWIDATADNDRVGDLPLQDQGRQALIIDAASAALVTTPVGISQQNRLVYNVDVRFPQSGNANITVNLDAFGSFESRFRSLYAADAPQVRERVELFAKKAFGAKKLGAYTVTPQGDFSKPFHLSFEALESSAAIADATEAAVALSNGLILEHLPYALISDKANAEKEDKPRTSDFLFPEPYQATVNFKVWPPSGTSPKPLPPPVSFTSQDFTYQFTNHANRDGSVELTYSIDTGSRRITAAQLTTLSKGIAANVKPGTVLEFTFKTGDLLALGKSAEALHLAQQTATAKPQDVAAQIRYAGMLMDCGAGKRALAVAEQAVQSAPQSAQAWYTLGRLRQYDSFGRLRAPGWQPLEAEKALRRAMELDATNTIYPVELAILLEFDASGQRYSKAARLPEAVALYQKALAANTNSAVRQNLIFAQMHLGQYKEALDGVNAELANQPLFSAAKIALTALINGTDRAIIDSQSSAAPESRSANLLDAARTLMALRRYKESAELAKAAERLAGGSASEAALPFISKTSRYDESLAPDDDPKRPVQLLLASIAGIGPPDDQLKAILSEHADLATWRSRVWRAREHSAIVAQNILSSGITPDVLADLTVSNAELTIHGEGKPGYLVEIANHMMDMRLSGVIVVKENGRCKLLASTDSLAVVGKLALEQIEKGNLAAAQAWLDQVKDQALPIVSSDDKGPAFRYLWAGTAPETRNATFVRAAAASLLGTYAGSEEAVRILRLLAEHPVQYMERADVYFALCETFARAGNWKELLEASRPLAKSPFYAPVAYRFSANAHIHLNEWRELQAESETRLLPKTANPVVTKMQVKPNQPPANLGTHKQEDGWALYFGSLALLQQNRIEEARSMMKREEEAVFFSPSPDHQLSKDWAGLLSGKPSPSDSSDRSVFSGKNLPHLYTKAFGFAAADRLTECKNTLASALDIEQTGVRLSSLPWLVQGQMLKHYGLEADAASAFAKARELNDWADLPAAQFLLEKELAVSPK